jgi:acetylornithine deacetylase/succinyl-diaminopimelate desuccinylase-like protein
LAQRADDRPLARDILRELVGINTTDPAGDNTRAAQAMADRLLAAGYPAQDVQVLGPAPRKGNLVARLRGSGNAKSILFLAHLDVVEARRDDWSFDPFTLLEKDGHFYGRGTHDNKGDAALLVANFIRLKREGYRPSRDLILALTADEETGSTTNGVDWLIKNKRALIDAEYCLNSDSGGGHLRQGKRVLLSVQAAEKGFLSLRLRATNPGGHSSLPVKENAIYRLAAGLGRLEHLEFPPELNPVTQGFFESMGAIETGPTAEQMRAVAKTPMDERAAAELSKSPYFNALLRNTCIPTLLAAGHAQNALPQTADATVNCRLLPGIVPAVVENAVKKALNDPQISVTPITVVGPNPYSAIPPQFMARLKKVTHSFWPGLPVVPVMETGGTDGKTLRVAGIPTYGVSALFHDVEDIRAHGKDERILVQSFYEGLEFQYQLIKTLSE